MFEFDALGLFEDDFEPEASNLSSRDGKGGPGAKNCLGASRLTAVDSAGRVLDLCRGRATVRGG